MKGELATILNTQLTSNSFKNWLPSISLWQHKWINCWWMGQSDSPKDTQPWSLEIVGKRSDPVQVGGPLQYLLLQNMDTTVMARGPTHWKWKVNTSYGPEGNLPKYPDTRDTIVLMAWMESKKGFECVLNKQILKCLGTGAIQPERTLEARQQTKVMVTVLAH